MQKDEKALGIILPEIEEMKEEGKYSYRDGKPNLAELSRRTGFSRKVLGRLSRKGFKAGPGTDERKTGAGGKVMTAEQAGRAKELLAQGVTNSSVLYRELREVGYPGRHHDRQDVRRTAQGPCPGPQAARAASGRAGAQIHDAAGQDVPDGLGLRGRG